MLRRYNEITDVIQHYWNARAVTFDSDLGHVVHSNEQRQAWLQFLAGLAGPAPQRVLDVGCGTGFLALMFAEIGHTVTGIDLASQMLDLARQKARQANLNIEFRLEDAASVGDADNSYDLVVARHVIWTLPDPERAVADWFRVLRRGGRLALIEGKWGSDKPKARHRRSIRATLTAAVHAGLSLVSVGRKHWNALKYERVYAQLPFSGGPPADRLVAFLEAQGLHDVKLEPLMSPALWGETPRWPRYLVVGEH